MHKKTGQKYISWNYEHSIEGYFMLMPFVHNINKILSSNFTEWNAFYWIQESTTVMLLNFIKYKKNKYILFK